MPEMMSDEPIEYPITDVLDLHNFRPQEIKSLVRDYLEECHHRKIYTIRIIHGKGKSVQKHNVRNVLKAHTLVTDFYDAPQEQGGWGATIVHLKEEPEEAI